MKRIIINADDFGINEVVTSEIERMILSGAISSTTIMANGACLDEVRRFTVDHPEVSYGVHLCLSEFDSLTKSEVLYKAGLTNKNGEFIHKAIFDCNNLNDPAIQNAIHDELIAQIDLISSFDIPISHADSHHHVHTIFPLRYVFAKVLQERGINKIRIGEEFRSVRNKLHVLKWYKRTQLNNYYRSQFVSADSFFSYADYINASQKIKDGVIELMCHPGHQGTYYKDEMSLVESKLALNDVEIKLINYNELH